jgi:hypothetical protein
MMTYTQLCTNIQDYVENSFSADQLANFTQQAEQRIYNSVQLPALRKTATLTATSSSPYLNCPNDYLSTFSLAVIDALGDYYFLLDKDVSYIREAYPSAATTAQPKYYALFGGQVADDAELRFILGPTPNSAYSLELQYFYYPESIVTAGQTWLGDNFDSALLWGSIVEAYHFLKGEPDLIAIYQNRYQEALALLKMLGDGKERGDAYRDGQVKLKVM